MTGLSLNEGNAGRGALLSFVYCLGLGLPFIFAALAYRRMLGTVGWVRRHQQWVTAIGGLMLIAVGLLLVTGWWDELVDWIRTWFFPGFEPTGICSLSPVDVTPRSSADGTPTRALGPTLATARAGRHASARHRYERSAREFARWTWRQLTSMRTALILLFLLALAAIPGSVVPQEAVDSVRASQWRDQHPQLTPIYEKLGLFSVYDSVWFSAIYILLMVSLVGLHRPAAVRLLARRTRPAAEGAEEPLPAAGAPRVRGRRVDPGDRAGVAEAEALPGGGSRDRFDRRGGVVRRARLPARGRQPAVPPLGADRAGRVRASAGCSASRAA